MIRGSNARAVWDRRMVTAWVLAGLLGGARGAASPGATAHPGLTLRADGATFEFVRIPAGRFQMGSDSGDSDERPAHQVTIEQDVYMMTTEVTVRQFRTFVEAAGYQTDAERRNWAWLCPAADLAGPDRGLNWRTPGFKQSQDDPVVVLSWSDAAAFCRWLSEATGRALRLPTEAEWEYAAGATDLDTVAWYDANAGGRTHPAGRRRPNRWGLYDMQGNAWEWCLDVWHPSYDGAPTDGGARAGDPGIPEIAWRHVLRGGCWASPAGQLCPTYRYRGTTSFRNCGTGFRVVLDPNGRMGNSVAHAVSGVGTPDTVGDPSARRRGHATHLAKNEDGTTILTAGGVEFNLVRIRGGRFVMGSNVHGEEQPVHEVTIGYDFEIGRTEVTRGQFRAFVGATGYITEAEKEGWGWTRSNWRDWHPELDIDWRHPGFAQTDEHPATCVSWYDAMAFCRWLSRETGETIRLPSGAEWEYACRAVTTTDYAGDVKAMAWYRYNSGQQSHPVAQKQPNAWGLYDMHGNVWEWCQDMWHDGYDGAPVDGSPWTRAMSFIPLMRGGSFTNPIWWLRSANHMRNDPGCRHSYNQGLRIVRELRAAPNARGAATVAFGSARDPDTSTRKMSATNSHPAKLVPIELELPTPMYVGTKENIRVPRLRKVRTEGGPPFLAPEGTRNVALGKPVSSSDELPVIGELGMIADGDKEAADGSYVELGPFLQHVTIDLQSEHEIYAVRLWHYHQTPRVYFDVIVQIAGDPDFVGDVSTIFNNDADNSAGLGVGSDMHYVETHFGELLDASGVRGRYVRLYSSGSTGGDTNHYIEIEVYGRVAGQAPTFDCRRHLRPTLHYSQGRARPPGLLLNRVSVELIDDA